jgi:hypothetical protein
MDRMGFGELTYQAPLLGRTQAEALFRVSKHREPLIAANPSSDGALVDEALRCALTPHR